MNAGRVSRGTLAAIAAGFAVLASQSAVALADPSEGTPPGGDARGHAHSRPSAHAPATAAVAAVAAVAPVAPPRQFATARTAPTPAASSSGSRFRTAAATAQPVKNPILAFLFNDTPGLNPTQDAPGAGGVVRGALNADDPDGDALTYTVVRNPEHGQVSVDSSGAFTYTPASPGGVTSSDTFDVTVSDADSGFHLHGLSGLINLLTFGLLGTAGHSSTRTVTVNLAGPATTTAYLVPLAPGVTLTPILTVGESPVTGSYQMVGSPDGLGVYDNNDGTFTLLMNHELSSAAGAVHAHGATGAFISRYVIDKSTLRVLRGSDLIQRVYGWDATAQASESSPSTVSFNRFCSADLAAESAFSYGALGTSARIFLTGEEGGSGRAVATIATGADAGSSYILGRFNPGTNGSGLAGTPSWENLLANPFAQDKTVVIGNNDGGSGVMSGALAVYVGTKQSTGTDADRAGLTNGALKFISITGNPTEIADATTRATTITSGTAFTLSATSSTTFSRPEDGAWNPLNPQEYYFVTTDRLDQSSDGVGAQVGRSRLWRLNFSDITNPDAGGTIDLLIDGDTVGGRKVNMLDNIAIDRAGRILIQEDTGAAAHNAKIWEYDIATDSLTLLAEHDPARFGDIGVAATAPFTTDEESSGIVDAQDVLGAGWFLLTDMAHYPLGGDLVEGGQLLALYDPV